MGRTFAVNMMVKGNGTETVIDKKNEVAIQIFGMGEGAAPMYNAGGYKYPPAEDLKKLEIVPLILQRISLAMPVKSIRILIKRFSAKYGSPTRLLCLMT